MKVAFLLLAICLIGSVISATNNYFVVDYKITSPNINGVIRGVMYYSEQNRAILMEQTGGIKELSIYSTDQNKLFKYSACSGGCETEPLSLAEGFPIYYKKSSDSCSPQGSNFVCTRNDASNVKSLVVDGSDNTISVTLKDDRTITFTSALRDGITADTFKENIPPFNECKLNCVAELDIVLVVDESGSIDGNYIPSLGVNQGEWAQQRNFAIKFVEGFEISPKKVHMGLVQFSKGSRKVLPAPHIISDQATYRNVINGLTKKLCTSDPREWNTRRECHGATYTGHGLIDAIEILQDKSGTRALRANAGKIIVMVTDGNSYYPGQSGFNYKGKYYAHPSGWVQHTKNSGATVITVGVGNNIDFNELRSYSSLDSAGEPLVFAATTFNYLQSAELIEKLGRTVCTANGVPQQCGGTCKGSCQCGSCVCPTDCEDDNKCRTGVCTASINSAGGCFYTPVDCDDQNACTLDECDPVTGCSHTPIVCNDNNPCTEDSCDINRGCVYKPVECPVDNFCQVRECVAGTCTAPTTNPVCETENNCTEAIPDGSGVRFEPITCPPPPEQPDPCQVYGCDSHSGCFSTPKNCSDGNLCTTDVCSAGDCINDLITCDDNDMCTDDTCDGKIGCVHTPFDPAVRCDDGNICTIDTCEPNIGCVNTPIVCNATIVDGCIVGVCDPFEGCIDAPRQCEPTVVEGQDPNCTVAVCENGGCTETFTELCANNQLLTAAITAGTTLIVAIVIIAAIVCLGAGAGGAYAAFSAVAPADFDNTSGIYESGTTIGVSGIHQ